MSARDEPAGFNPIWQAIKGWDIQRAPGAGYHGPTGDDVRTILSALTAAGYVILPAEMTAEQAARSLAGSAMADRMRVSAPDIYALLVKARRATWREMVAVMGESGDE